MGKLQHTRVFRPVWKQEKASGLAAFVVKAFFRGLRTGVQLGAEKQEKPVVLQQLLVAAGCCWLLLATMTPHK